MREIYKVLERKPTSQCIVGGGVGYGGVAPGDKGETAVSALKLRPGGLLDIVSREAALQVTIEAMLLLQYGLGRGGELQVVAR